MYSPHSSRRRVFPHGQRQQASFKPRDDVMLSQLFQTLEQLLSDSAWARQDGIRTLSDPKGWIPLVKVIQLQEISEILQMNTTNAIQTVQHTLKTNNSSLIQVHRNGSCIRRFPLKHRLRSYVEFLFGDENYARDLELQFIAEEAGFVPIVKLFETRPKFLSMVQSGSIDLAAQMQAVQVALSDSVLLEIAHESTMKLAVRRRSLAGRVVRQVEFYLSREHMQHDSYLNELMADNGDGWIRLQDVLAFPRMKQICLPQEASVARVLQTGSEKIEVREDFCIRPTWYVKEHGLQGLDEIVEDGAVDETPPQSPMLPWYPSKATSDFRVMTWNILADFLCRRQLYPYCDAKFLQWHHRKALVIAEIARTRPSIICLQELQGIGTGGSERADHARQVLSDLDAMGYGSTYLRKALSGQLPNLGNAVLWNRSMFQLVRLHEIKFNEVIGQRCYTDASRWYFGSPQVAIIAFLSHTGTGKIVAVASTHISCAWETPVKQVAQVQELLLQIGELVPPQVPVILAGDFNSLAGSAAYRLITEGEVSLSDPQVQIDVQEQAIGIHLPYPKLHAPRRFASAYRFIQGREPMFTNFTAEPKSFSGTLDYVFFSTDGGLEAKAVMEVPGFDACRKEVALPSSVYPSDHLPLAACFSFTNR
eukprot:m.492944 g.492944  ORF g.492944 m.492944 type:complete len:649 (-) comp21790_c0_seq4:147-2093(-)